MSSLERQNLVEWLERLDARHRRYAQEYADELALGDPKPSSKGLDRATVREIRRRIWAEWRRRIDAMPGSRS